ncbi:cysteine-rich secretory protein 3-like [Perognathus longimembris pacificus]|uniref:cysteine-rich secretory protein 3-like n=1 Tax=Perognathus longimembris pacificus TaxID=214514 RepID=UPI002019AA09|nr:cysteine-rich secretory protein 3-like [Perognathus longimembris pacificus]
MGPLLVLLFLVPALCPFSPAEGRQVRNKAVASVSTTLRAIQKEIVNKHNELRRDVEPSASNMLKMSWSAKAAANAQRWAEQCNYKHSDSKFRATNLSCGENLFMSTHLTTWSHAIQSWYDEYLDLIFGQGPTNPGAVVGHYTQVVWYASYLVGCGVAYCPQQYLKVYMVCHYCPAGNFRPRLYSPYKAGEPCSLCPDDCDNGLCTNSCAYEDNYANCKDLKKSVTCKHPMVKNNCGASCNCSNKIYNGPITDD